MAARGLVAFLMAVNEPRGLHPGLFQTADSARYLELAGSLLHGRFETTEGPEAYRLPLYPLFLTPAAASDSPTVVALTLQTLACALIAVLVWQTAGRAGFDRRVALAAGLLCALEPTLLLWSLQVMAEAPLALAVTLAAMALVEWSRTGQFRYCAIAMLCGSAAALTKSAAILVPLTLAALAPILVGQRTTRWRVRVGLTALLIAMAPLGIWIARNAVVIGHATYSTQVAHFDRTSAYLEWRTQNPHADSAQLEAQRARFGVEKPTSTRSSETGLSWQRAVLHVRGVVITAISPGGLSWAKFLGIEPRSFATSRQLFRQGRWAVLADTWTNRPVVSLLGVGLAAVALCYWLLFGAGLVEARRRQPALAWIALVITLSFLAVSGGPWAQSRFRVPFVSVWCLVAGLGWVTRREHARFGADPRRLPGSMSSTIRASAAVAGSRRSKETNP